MIRRIIMEVDKSRYGEASESRSKFAEYAKLGIEYIF